MRKLLFILLLCSSAFGQLQQKPMHGEQVNWAHQLGDPVAAWFFLEGSGNTVKDLSGNGNHGTFAGDTNWVAGKFGSSVDFPGTDDYIQCTFAGLSSLSNGKLTIIASIKIDAFQDRGTIIALDTIADRWFRINNGTQKLEFVGDAGLTIAGNTALNANTWYDVAIVLDGTNGTFYVDGVPDGGGAETSTSTVDKCLIGAYTTTLREMDGQISHLLIYNRVLSASEIALFYPEPFCMFQRDDIALMEAAIPTPSGGQVISIQMTTMIPLFIIPLFLIWKRNFGNKTL